MQILIRLFSAGVRPALRICPLKVPPCGSVLREIPATRRPAHGVLTRGRGPAVL